VIERPNDSKIIYPTLTLNRLIEYGITGGEGHCVVVGPGLLLKIERS
jgi:hypothetical protein